MTTGVSTSPSAVPQEPIRPSPGSVMVATGAGAVVVGGLVAAVTGPLDLAHGSWAAAFLVLVCGVAQVAMGESRNRQPPTRRRPPTSGRASALTFSTWTQWGCWNSGGVTIIVGTLVGQPWLVDLGSVLLFIALTLALDATRTGVRRAGRGSRPWLVTYRAVLLVLAVSIPIGIALSHIRHG